MPDTIRTGTILLKDGTFLPTDLLIESEIYAPSWKVVKSFDGLGLTRKINEADWNFFYLAGHIKASVLGREGQKTVRRGVKQILAKLKGEQFNSLEITEVVSKRFLGIPFVSVTAHIRHFQKDVVLVAAKNFVKTNPLKIAAKGPPVWQGTEASRRNDRRAILGTDFQVLRIRWRLGEKLAELMSLELVDEKSIGAARPGRKTSREPFDSTG